jgi:aspartate racemase
MEKTVGVLGGMGPEATVAFFKRLISLTPAEKDQDHLSVLIVNNPKVPDRTMFLRGLGESPVPQLQELARSLERMGADFIAIPCNTAHAFWAEISSVVGIPVLNIIEETVSKIAGELLGDGEPATTPRIGILATEGTLDSQLYQTALSRRGLASVVPRGGTQQKVSQVTGRYLRSERGA